MKFTIKGMATGYEFYYKAPAQSQPMIVGELPVENLNPICTGPHLGVFSQGVDGRPVLGAAVFAVVEYHGFD